MVERNDELNSLIYGFLVKEQCYETAAYFLQDINYQVDNDTVKSKIRLEEVFMQYKKKGSGQHNAYVNIGNIDDSSSSDDDFSSIDSSSDDSDNSDKSDIVYIKTNLQGVKLPSINDIFGADPTQRGVTNQKRIELDLFREYNNHFGDLKVPKMFTVPYEASWSQKYHGAKLGRIVDAIRQSLKANKLDYCEDELQELLQMGFVTDANVDKRHCIVLAFQIFVAKYGHGDVPHLFSIGKDDESWPQEVRGFNLGTILHTIRSYGKLKHIHQQLIDVGIDITTQVKILTTEQVHLVLSIYQHIHGSVAGIKKNYIVPDSPDYPEYAWGFGLGHCVKNITDKGAHATYIEQWKALGLQLRYKLVRSTKDVSFEEICEAIECYKSIHGHLNIAETYLVSVESSFPSHLHGIKLGKIVYGMRNANRHVKNREQLLQLGIVVGKRSNDSMRNTTIIMK